MTGPKNSLEAYAHRWMELGKFDIAVNENLYFTPYDQIAARFQARGKTLVSFSHYDYLGLARHPQIAAAACEAIMTSGTGAGASRMVGGEISSHGAFERDLAEFLGVGQVLSLVSGYATNVSLLGHLLGANDVIIADDLSHNSILSGVKLSRAQSLSFKHNDMDSLEHLLRTRRAEFSRALIVIEGLYSMDGDIPDLNRILALREKYNAWVMIDEAHSIGVLGKTGRGISEHYDTDPARIDLIMGTLSKTFVACGGFIGGKSKVIEWLRYTLPGFIYSVGLPPPINAATHAALKIISREPERVTKMRRNSEYFLEKARAAGLETGQAIGAGVVPVMLDDVVQTVVVSRFLLDAGFYVPPIIQVGVPKDKPRLRFFLSAHHEFAEIDATIKALRAIIDHPMTAAAVESVRKTPALAGVPG